MKIAIDISRILLGYNFQNIALLVNIHRWELILKASGTIQNGLTISKQLNENELPFSKRKIVFINYFVFIGILTLYLLNLMKITQFELLFFLFQGLTVNIFLLILFYMRIYRYFKAFNIELLVKYKEVYHEEDATKIRQTIREVKIFFTLIIIVLTIQSNFLLWMVFSTSGSINLTWNDRVFDIFFVLASTSFVFLILGISRSIKKSYKVQLKQKLLSKQQDSINSGAE
jgi:phosphoglycerol transferase MdoB-like AlkP superfamily enzyme